MLVKFIQSSLPAIRKMCSWHSTRVKDKPKTIICLTFFMLLNDCLRRGNGSLCSFNLRNYKIFQIHGAQCYIKFVKSAK